MPGKIFLRRPPAYVAVAIFAFLILSVLFRKDPLNAISQQWYDRFSEGYVLCSVIKNQTDPRAGFPHTGLGVQDDKGECYRQFVDTGYTRIRETDPYPLTDENWNAGVARHFPGVLIRNTRWNLLKYQAGQNLVLPDGHVEKIDSIDVSQYFMTVKLAGPIIDPSYFSIASVPPLKPLSGEWNVYYSQIGLAGYFFSGLFDLTKFRSLTPYRLVNSTLLAAVFAGFAALTFAEFGALAVVALLLGIVASPWMMGFASNLYWFEWTWFVPMLVVSAALAARKQVSRGLGWKAYLAYALAIALKCTLGYEYLSTIMIASVVPIVYVTVRNGESILAMIREVARVGVSGVCGFVAVVITHAMLLSPRFSEGLSIVKSKIIVRTFPTNDPTLGYGASSLDVLVKYFGVLLQPIFIGVDKPFYWTLSALAFAAAALMFTGSAKHRALGVAFFASIAAPLSWFVLAKGHSFVHPFLNPVLWNVPTVLMGLVCVGTLVSDLGARISQRTLPESAHSKA